MHLFRIVGPQSDRPLIVQPGDEDSAIKKGGIFGMQVSSGRSEKRIAKAVEVTGYWSDGSSLSEGTVTENVSTRGTRIVTNSKLQPGGTIEIHSRYGGFWLHGRVVYCQPLFGGKFAAGVETQPQNSPETPKDKSWNPS